MTKRKTDHLELAQKAQRQYFPMKSSSIYYEPLFATHIGEQPTNAYELLGRKLMMPFWISSMTGGEKSALKVNSDLARACAQNGLGLGLGSCRVYIDEPDRRDDFHIRELMPESCLAINLGIAQVEQYLKQDQWDEVEERLKQIKADFLFIHINPLQEWLQPEGDNYSISPLETLHKLKQSYKGKLGVKEVGQGFGPKSLAALVELEVDVIELAGRGGTNFTTLERMRIPKSEESAFEAIGHHWSEMVPWLNALYKDSKKFPEIIISGGIHTAVEAAKASLLADFPHLIGMGYTFLKWQRMGEIELQNKISEFYQDYLFALSILDKNLDIGKE